MFYLVSKTEDLIKDMTSHIILRDYTDEGSVVDGQNIWDFFQQKTRYLESKHYC